MSAFCMPMLIINMGGEMVYILEQRLHAQNVPMDKSKRGAHYHPHYWNSTPTPRTRACFTTTLAPGCGTAPLRTALGLPCLHPRPTTHFHTRRRPSPSLPPALAVLQDVIRTMYNPKFIAELFRGQDVYSMQSTRQIFDKLAHSSIMRLNESSMDKLFDLMTMGFKYQMIACRYPQELLHVTLNHLYQLRAKIDDAAAVADLVDEAIRATNERYASMSPAEFFSLKQALCRFFEDKHVKVSLFLQDGIQKSDGTIALSNAGPLPPDVEVPGRIIYFDQSGGSVGVDSFAFPGVDDIDLTPGGSALSPQRQNACILGLNLYSKDKPAPAAPGGEPMSAAAAAAAAAAHPNRAPSSYVDSATAERAILSGDLHSSMRDLNLLAELIGGALPPANDSFKLNLFPDTSMDGPAGIGQPASAAPAIMIDGGGTKALRASNRNLMGIMDEFRQPAAGYSEQGGDDEDDLLGLMDAAQ